MSKKTISVAFSKIDSFENVKDDTTEEKVVDAQECFSLKSATNKHRLTIDLKNVLKIT